MKPMKLISLLITLVLVVSAGAANPKVATTPVVAASNGGATGLVTTNTTLEGPTYANGLVLNDRAFFSTIGSSTNLSIDIDATTGKRAIGIAATQSFRFLLDGTAPGTNDEMVVFLNITNSSGGLLYVTNAVDTLTPVGNWGTIYPGKNVIQLNWDGFGWSVSQDTATIPLSKVADVSSLALAADLDTANARIDLKQDILEAGTGITIENNIISSTTSALTFSGEATTSSTTDTPVWTNSIPANRKLDAWARVSASGPTNRATYRVRGSTWRGSGAATLDNAAHVETAYESTAGMDAFFNVVGNDLILYVKGPASETNNWAYDGNYQYVVNGTASGGSATLLIDQNFEGTGYDNGESSLWSATGLGVNEDGTTWALRGSQSLEMIASSSDASATVDVPGAYSEIYFHFRYQFRDGNLATQVREVVYIGGNGGFEIQQIGNNNLRFSINNVTSANSSFGALTANVMYHIWVYLKSSTGAGDGIATMWIDTDETKPVSSHLHVTDHARTSNTGSIQFRADHVGGYGMTNVFDQVQVSTSAIGDVSP